MFQRRCLILLTFVIILLVESTALPAADYRLILIDRTGSMGTIRYTGNTRLQDAKTTAKQDVLGFPGQTMIAVRYFDSGGYVHQLDFTNNKQTVLNAIDNIPGPGALTPLADALCKAAHELKTIAQQGDEKRLYTYTDGGENYSNGSNPDICDTCDFLVGTGWNPDCDPCDNMPVCTDWQICLTRVLINAGVNMVRYFGQPITAVQEYSSPIQTRKSIMTSEGLNEMESSDLEFLKCVALQSGGSFTTMPDTLPACSDGIDNDGDGCTDYPYDLGCTSAQDNSEAEGGCPPPMIPSLTTYGIIILAILTAGTGIWGLLRKRAIYKGGTA